MVKCQVSVKVYNTFYKKTRVLVVEVVCISYKLLYMNRSCLELKIFSKEMEKMRKG